MSLFTPNPHWASDEHRMFSEMANRFFADEMAPNIDRWVEQGVVDRTFG